MTKSPDQTGHRGDGDGWVRCAGGHRHWGRYGAAGLLLRDGDRVLLQHRAVWSHHGGTWGVPGGARDSGESARETALREAAEEAGIEPSSVRLSGLAVDDHGGWSYSTLLAEPVAEVHPRPTDPESIDIRWHRVADVPGLPLHPGFAASWPALTGLPPAPALVVDAANVVGSRPDGWWRDRLGAARRLHDELAAWAADGLPADELPELAAGAYDVIYPWVLLVIEGQAAGLAVPAGSGVEIVPSAGSGDDQIVKVVAALAGRPVLVITADRELRQRVTALSATVAGPRWLWSALASTPTA